jgi:hypothetical protein
VPKLTFTSPSNVSLEFAASLAEAMDAPSETIHNVQTYSSGGCQNADSTYSETLWFGEFVSFYEQAQMFTYDSVPAALVDSGWRAGEGNVYAKRTVSGSFPAETPSPGSGSWTDIYEILKKKK